MIMLFLGGPFILMLDIAVLITSSKEIFPAPINTALLQLSLALGLGDKSKSALEVQSILFPLASCQNIPLDCGLHIFSR